MSMIRTFLGLQSFYDILFPKTSGNTGENSILIEIKFTYPTGYATRIILYTHRC